MKLLLFIAFITLTSLFGFSQTEGNINKAMKYVAKGDKQYAKGKYKKSVALYTNAIELYPNHEFIYYDRGMAYKAMGELTLAFADFDRGILFNTSSRTCYLERGLIYLQQQNYEDAIYDFNKHIEINGEDDATLEHKILALLAIEDYAKALPILDQLLTRSPENVTYLTQRATCNLVLGQLKKAYIDLKKLNALGDVSYEHLKIETLLFLQIRDFQNAIMNAKRNVQFSGSNPDSYHLLSTVYFENQQFDSAIIAINNAIAIIPKVAYFYDRACYFAENNQLDSALADFNETIRLDAQHIGAYNNRTFYIWFPQKKFENAVEDLTKIIDIDTMNAFAYSNRSYAYYSLNQIERGFLDAFKSFDLEPRNPYLYKNFALLYSSIGEDTEAISMIQNALDWGFPAQSDPEFLALLEFYQIPIP